MVRYPIVELEWEDAYACDDVHMPDDPCLRRSLVQKQVGYLIHRRPVVLAFGIMDGKLRGTITIPRSLVKGDIKVLA